MKERKLTSQDIRYFFEQKALPALFYQDPHTFIAHTIAKGSQYIYDILDELYTFHGVENPYSPEQFEIRSYAIDKTTEDVFASIITFPTPEEAPLCHYSLLVFDVDVHNAIYFAAEQGYHKSNKVLCGWTPELKPVIFADHNNEDINVLLSYCQDVFDDSTFGKRNI